ncbi:MATE family efflux transporter [Qingshengfaniella alkalisoli]|nr:MATE family efflux transporter [Qingshengfaniella alkalisoli]
MTYPEHARKMLALGLPLIGSQLAQVAVQVTDTVMMGWYGIEELAALVLAHSIYFTTFVLGAGFAWAVMPVVASASEEGDEVQIRRVTRMGLWASLGFVLLVVGPFMLSEPLFLAMGQDPVIATLASQYLRIAAWGLIPALLFMVIRSYLSGLERTQIVLWVAVAGAVLNVFLNYILIFGNFGAPELGVRGAAIASVGVHCLSLIVAAIYAARSFPEHDLFARLWKPDWQAFGQVFRLGWPIGITNLAEVGLFAFSSIMMGWVGPQTLAAHGIALQLISMTFMIHIGLSQAATIRAGRAFGRKDPEHLKKGALTGIAMSAAVAIITATAFIVTPEPLVALFLDPNEPARDAIIAICVSLLVAAAMFQVADAMQVIALGLLRGMQDTRVPMVLAAVSYWALGAPFAYIVAFPMGFEGLGIWLGLALGLTCAALAMMWRFWRRTLPSLSPRT